MDDKFYLQLNLINIITIFLMWLIVAVVIGAATSYFYKGDENNVRA
jgi:hypothetical protein